MIFGLILLLALSPIYAYPKDPTEKNEPKIAGRFKSFGDLENLLPGSQYEGQQRNFNQQPSNFNNVPNPQQFGFNNQPGYSEYRPVPKQVQYPNQFYPNQNYFQQYPNQPGPYQSQFPQQQYPNQNVQGAPNVQGGHNLNYPQQYPNQMDNFYPSQYPQTQNQNQYPVQYPQNSKQYPNQDGMYQQGNMMYPTQFQDKEESKEIDNKSKVPDEKEDAIAFPDD